MENQTQKNGKFTNWLKTSLTARLITVGVLTLLLLIPLSYIKDLIQERMYRQQEVVNEINQKWGGEVILYGPIIKVPYKSQTEKKIYNKNGNNYRLEVEEEINYAYFFPKELDITSNINPEEKKRGIYTTAVYKSSMNVQGTFTKPDFSETDIKPENIIWDKSKIIVLTSNLKGVNNNIGILFNNQNYPLTSQHQKDHESIFHILESKFMEDIKLLQKEDISFAFELSVNGSEQIRFIPIGKETNVNIKSNWKTANFLGEYLPYNSDKISENGFDAKWKVLDINRPFPQQSFEVIPDLYAYAFGVNFMIPVDEYQKSERSAKYGFLVISLTFLVFFLIQSMSKISIHPFQYLMIGIALTMFYTLLISISEHSSFLQAYLIASIAVITLITLYSKSILKLWKFTLLIGTSLTVLYGFIFVIIQLESYALLVGSIGLFSILAAIMFASRKIDWKQEA